MPQTQNNIAPTAVHRQQSVKNTATQPTSSIATGHAAPRIQHHRTALLQEQLHAHDTTNHQSASFSSLPSASPPSSPSQQLDSGIMSPQPTSPHTQQQQQRQMSHHAQQYTHQPSPANYDDQSSMQEISDDYFHNSELPDDEQIAPHTIETILTHSAFNTILPRIFSFLSVVELCFISTTDRRWHAMVDISCRYYIETLNLSQFWSRLGVLDIELFRQLVSRFERIRHVSLAYCHKLSTQTLIDILSAIPTHQNIHKLNLFYCFELTDESIDVVLQLLPKLTELNVGRCTKLTNKAIDLLADSSTLRKLVIVANPNITNEVTNYFDDPNKFRALKVLNIVNCTELSQEAADEARHQRPSLRIVGPSHQLLVEESTTAAKRMKQHARETWEDRADD